MNGVVHDTPLNKANDKLPCECEMRPFLGEWRKCYILQLHSWLSETFTTKMNTIEKLVLWENEAVL